MEKYAKSQLDETDDKCSSVTDGVGEWTILNNTIRNK